ncbi:hypothetical protein E4T43_08638 [Aureobasidium subglaciale]|nr:hypothetical protein E4T43_08638 [Aureobasidium subglaciale]
MSNPFGIKANHNATEVDTAYQASKENVVPPGPETEARKDGVPETQHQTPISPKDQGTKRSIEESTINDPDIYPDETLVTDNCQVVRNKINRLIEFGEMKVTDFCSAIGVSSNAYYNLMHKHGTMKGADCAAYPAAFSYFQKREEAGLKLPTKKQKTKDDDKGKGKSEKAKDDKLDLSDVHLDGKNLITTNEKNTKLLTKTLQGEETDSVPVYDTCDDIRRQITAYLEKTQHHPSTILPRPTLSTAL